VRELRHDVRTLESVFNQLATSAPPEDELDDEDEWDDDESEDWDEDED
jgi:hypothetical protein